MYQQHSFALPTCDGSISHVDFLGNNLLELVKIQVSHMICNNVCHCDTNRIVVLHIALENVNTVSYDKYKQIMFTTVNVMDATPSLCLGRRCGMPWNSIAAFKAVLQTHIFRVTFIEHCFS